MNEKELERRFRSVAEGTQPNAPQSLRHFLHELPETQPARRWTSLRLLGQSLTHARMPRLAFGGAAVAFAVVVGLVGGNLLLGIRGNNNVAATPTFAAGGFLWTGNLDARAMVPRAATAGGPEGYLGVGPSADGTGVLLTSRDALHWSEKQTSAIDPKTVDLRWIARGDVGFVAVGATLRPTSGPSATPPRADPRFFYSTDGSNWQESAVDDSLKGAPALTVVVGPNGFLAAGWNGSNAAEAGMAGTYLWASTDGRRWSGGWTQAAVNGKGFLMGSPDTYLMSGDPVPVGYEPQGALPIFTSAEGFQAWSQTSGAAGLAHIGPAIGGVATDSDKKLLLLVWATKADATAVGGKTELIGGDAGGFSAVATAASSPVDLRSLVLVGGKTLLATAASGSIYVSSDWGVDWQRVEFGASRPTPTGQNLIDLGIGKYLLLGEGGIWVATPL